MPREIRPEIRETSCGGAEPAIRRKPGPCHEESTVVFRDGKLVWAVIHPTGKPNPVIRASPAMDPDAIGKSPGEKSGLRRTT